MQTGKMARYFSDLELFAMLVACLVHNIGFRGHSYSMIVRSHQLIHYVSVVDVWLSRSVSLSWSVCLSASSSVPCLYDLLQIGKL